MSSFHEVQDKLLLSCEDGILDEDELICYYTSNLCPKNPNFLHEEYDRFSLNETNDAECLAECRFRKHDLQILSEVLQIPNSFRCYQRSVVDGMEGLCLPLRRLLKIAITKLLFETQMTAIKLGWDSHSRGIYFTSLFS